MIVVNKDYHHFLISVLRQTHRQTDAVKTIWLPKHNKPVNNRSSPKS